MESISLREAIFQINRIKTHSTSERRACTYLFHALEQMKSKNRSFACLKDRISKEYLQEFVESQELKALVEFKLNAHFDMLNKAGNLAERHEDMVQAYVTYEKNPSVRNLEVVFDHVSSFLDAVKPVVNCGERIETDFCTVLLQVLIKLIDFVLDRPSQKLVVYGTLAPGERYHYLLQDIAGTWLRCKVVGRITKKRGLKYFKWIPDGEKIDAYLFISESLPKKWAELDEFEGSEYRRIFVPVEVDKQWIVANIYEEAS